MLIGLTGSIGAGKSTVSKILSRDYKVIDADAISNMIFKEKEVEESILKVFGTSIQDNSKKIDRKKVREIIFSNPSLKVELENIMHPLINTRILLEIQSVALEDIVIFDIPLLFECGYEKYMDKIIVVGCDRKVQVNRIIKRDNSTKEEAEKIINSQLPQETKRIMADFYIDNSGSMDSLESNVEELLITLKKIKNSFK